MTPAGYNGRSKPPNRNRHRGANTMTTVNLKIGTETAHPQAIQAINRELVDGEYVTHHLGFDFSNKVMALSNYRLLIGDKDGGCAYWRYEYITDVPQTDHDREIKIKDRDGHETTWRVRESTTARMVRGELRQRVNLAKAETASHGPFLWDDITDPQWDNEEEPNWAEFADDYPFQEDNPPAYPPPTPEMEAAIKNAILLGGIPPNNWAIHAILRSLDAEETVDYYTSFDSQTKVMALTSDGLYVGKNDGEYAARTYLNLSDVPTPSHSQEIAILDRSGNQGTWILEDPVIARLIRIILKLRRISAWMVFFYQTDRHDYVLLTRGDWKEFTFQIELRHQEIDIIAATLPLMHPEMEHRILTEMNDTEQLVNELNDLVNRWTYNIR